MSAQAHPWGLVAGHTEETEVWLGFWHSDTLHPDHLLCVCSSRSLAGGSRTTVALECDGDGALIGPIGPRSFLEDRDEAVGQVLRDVSLLPGV